MFDLPTRSPDNGVLGLAMTFTHAAGGSPPEAISRRSPMVPERDTGDYRLHRQADRDLSVLVHGPGPQAGRHDRQAGYYAMRLRPIALAGAAIVASPPRGRPPVSTARRRPRAAEIAEPSSGALWSERSRPWPRQVTF